MQPHSDKLIAKARQGVKLSVKERRHCVEYMMACEPDTTNVAMGELFQVSERQIRLDKVYVRENRAKLIKEDDIALVIADIALNFDRQIRDIETSKRKAGVGSRTYLEHCRAIFRMELEKVQALQNLGYYPKSLGNMTIEKFEYKAVVSKDGSVDTRPVNLCIDLEAEVVEGDMSSGPRLLAAPIDATEVFEDGNDS